MVSGQIELEFWQRLLCAEAPAQRSNAAAKGCLMSSDPARALLEGPWLSAAERERARSAPLQMLCSLQERGAGVLSKEHLPALYGECSDVPAALFYWGEKSCLDRPLVGIVGTRAATTYGKAAAQKFAEAFARAGVTVVSGGALGIDAAAHKGALSGGGATAAVLLTGIEKVYPRVHYGLFEQIKMNGCLLSQFGVQTFRSREYRPLLRNQTLAALCSVLVVIEAPERSGALSTASAANEMGRQVFVVPANIDNVNFRGSHALIRDGASLVDHPDQVLEAIQIAPALPITAPHEELNEVQRKILSVLGSTPLAGDFIVQRTGLETSVVLSELTMLELEGRILKDAGGYALRL